jgi:hypothetical protein
MRKKVIARMLLRSVISEPQSRWNRHEPRAGSGERASAPKTEYESLSARSNLAA